MQFGGNDWTCETVHLYRQQLAISDFVILTTERQLSAYWCFVNRKSDIVSLSFSHCPAI